MQTPAWVAASLLLLLVLAAQAEAVELEQNSEDEGEAGFVGEGKCKAGESHKQPHLSLTTRTQRAQSLDPLRIHRSVFVRRRIHTASKNEVIWPADDWYSPLL
ncbi:hypothetical protein E2C01_087071 [Portunus trituberculatus]|uniref:Uncharacterized protein n=1 Tax=Portunus trituberculatus TaxID=210409 RepID=A0A5B7JCC7_PORTR|nr:hypothetical protein [Portunus trituberculatus]